MAAMSAAGDIARVKTFYLGTLGRDLGTTGWWRGRQRACGKRSDGNGLFVFVLAIVLHYQIAAPVWPRETREHTEIRFPTPEE